MQLTVTNKIMQCHTSKNNVLLGTCTATRDAFQNTPLLLQDSKRPLNDISNGWMQEIEHLILPLRRTPRTMAKFWNMVCASFERGKISYSVWVTRIHNCHTNPTIATQIEWLQLKSNQFWSLREGRNWFGTLTDPRGGGELREMACRGAEGGGPSRGWCRGV